MSEREREREREREGDFRAGRTVHDLYRRTWTRGGVGQTSLRPSAVLEAITDSELGGRSPNGFRAWP